MAPCGGPIGKQLIFISILICLSLVFAYKKPGTGSNDTKYTIIVQNLPKHNAKLKEVRFPSNRTSFRKKVLVRSRNSRTHRLDAQ